MITPAVPDLNGASVVSRHYDDVYFSTDDCIGESYYHFIEGNQLPQRFAQLWQADANEKGIFTIAETGFGTGLNFLLAAEAWLLASQRALRSAPVLHYISCEKHPIAKTTLKVIYEQQGWTFQLIEPLLKHYPETLTRQMRDWQFTIDGKMIRLTLLVGDATQQLNRYPFYADVWFLDGFAPRKNPALWSTALFEQVTSHSHPHATFATFTAASAVRKGLTEAGFDVRKTPGFGRKRERLVGRYQT